MARDKLKTRKGPCTVCASEFRHQVEIGLTMGTPCAALAARFDLSPSAIWRHGQNHLSPAQRAALLAQQKPTDVDLDALREREGEGLLAGLVAQRARLLAKADTAMELGDVKGSVSAENAIQSNYALVARLLGQLVQHHSVTHTNLLISPDYIKLRSTLVDALRPFPDAARAVAEALHRLESDAARDITDSARKRQRTLLNKPATVIECEAIKVPSPEPALMAPPY